MSFRISDQLNLPLETLSKKLAFLGTSGGGKTYAAMKLAEQMLHLGRQIVVIDPVGIWFGLRLDKAGKRPSEFNIPVFGGIRGDIPLDPGSGYLMADVVVDRNLSAIFDVSLLKKKDRPQFLTEFAEQFLARKIENRTPVHLFMEEAQLYIPEGKNSTLQSAYEDLVKIGRNYGVGSTLISQRPQAVSKEVLNQSQAVLAFQTLGKHERKAIADWCYEAGVDDDLDEVLTQLKLGQCRVWSPWLKINQTIKISARETYVVDPEKVTLPTSARPKPLSEKDLKELQALMGEVVERQRESDPTELKNKINTLTKELTAANRRADDALATVRTEVMTETTEVPVFSTDDLKLLHETQQQLRQMEVTTAAKLDLVGQRLASILSTAEALMGDATPLPKYAPKQAKPHHVPLPKPTQSKTQSSPKLPDEGLVQSMLDAVAWWESAGISLPNRHQHAYVSGLRIGGYYNRKLKEVRDLGYLDANTDGVSLTAAGRKKARPPASKANIAKFHELVLDKFTDPERGMVACWLANPGKVVSAEQLAEACGLQVGGYFNRKRSPLLNSGVATRSKSGGTLAADWLFPSELS